MPPKIIKKKYKVPLTQGELVEYGSQAGEIHKTLAQVQFESKNAAEAYKDKISGIKDDFSEIMTKIREKKEWRDLDCEEIADYEKKEMSWLYNGEMITFLSFIGREFPDDDRGLLSLA